MKKEQAIMENEPNLQPENKYKKCAFCSEEILEDALICKHCKSDLSTIKLNEFKEYIKVCCSGQDAT